MNSTTPKASRGPGIATVGYLFSVGAALSYAASQFLTRQKVGHSASPFIGAAISIFAGLVTLAPMALRDAGRNKDRPLKQAILFFSLSGLFTSIAVILLYAALDRATLVVVAPIIAINPLITLLLAQVFLRHLERVTIRTFLGVLIVVVGATLVSLG